jgi:predicted lipoprotein with Yx(FWY)xxD motif
MRRSIIVLAVVIGAAGCGSDSGGASGSSAGVVSVANVDGTDVLADSAGKTLYSAAVEKDGQVHCVGACTTFWQPVLASSAEASNAAAELDANLAVVKRPDGDEQLTFDGLPLYTFAEEGAGKLDGDGFADDFQGTHFEWKAARTGSSPDSGDGTPSQGYGY